MAQHNNTGASCSLYHIHQHAAEQTRSDITFHYSPEASSTLTERRVAKQKIPLRI